MLLLKLNVYAQLTGGINVNGQPVAQGDTIKVCAGSPLVFTSTASNYINIGWIFQLGTPGTFIGPNPPSIIYNTAGVDSAIQVISDGVVIDSFIVIIKVSDVHPIVNFTHDNNVCSGNSVQFNSTVTGTAPFTYTWAFANGNISNGPNAVQSFTSQGCNTQVFNNTLSVRDATGCISSITKPITILQAPEVELVDADLVSPFSNCENSPTPGNPNFTITLNNISPDAGCIASYNLDWGDGSPVLTGLSFASFPLTHTYTQIAAFNLVVTAFGSNGCIGTKTYTIANQTNPAGSLGTFGSTTGLCAPVTVPFTIGNWQINSTGTMYVLDYGDGTTDTLHHPLNPGFTTDTVYHTYTEASCPALSYTVNLSVINGCGNTPYSAGNIQVRKKAESAFIVNENSFCVGQDVCFTNTTIAGTGFNCSTIPLSTTWDFGDGSPVFSGTDACHAYSAPGVYTVTLTTNTFCGPDSYTMNICVTTPPTPGFTVDNLTGCLPLNVSTTNTTTALNNCEPAKYFWTVTYAPGTCGTIESWNFTNGTTETSVNPSFVFNGAGTYTITLDVASPCGTFTISRTVVVKSPPIVNVAPVANACGTVIVSPSATVDLCDATTPVYAWTFQGGSPATSSSLSPGPVAFSGAGLHTISLSVTNECGMITRMQQFAIDTVSVADAGAAQHLCGTVVTLAAVDPLIGTGQWTFNSGPNIPTITDPSSPSSTVTGLITGTYTFQWTVTNGTCSSSSTVNITIAGGPTPANAGPDQNLCLAISTTLAANTPALGTGQWSFVSGPNSPTSPNPNSPTATVNGLIPGTYFFRWTTSFANCTPSTDDVQVIVFDNPSATTAGIDQVTCSPDIVMAAGTPAIGNGNWTIISGPNMPAITSPSSPTTTITGLIPGTYNFQWTISNGVCPAVSDLVQVIVTPFPTVANAGGDMTICAATNINLAGNTPVIGTGQWSFVSGPNTPTSPNPNSPTATVNGLIPGTYVFRWTISNGVCPSSSDDVQVTISGSVTIADAGANQHICGTSYTMTGNTAVAGTGQWTLVSGPNTPTITSPSSPTTTVTGLIPGTYIFQWTISNGVCSTNSNVTITIASGPTPANAGPDQNLCLLTSTNLLANTPTLGTGQWTYVSGPAGYTITDPLIANTSVTGLVPGVYVFRWTTNFSNCTPSTDDVQVTVYANPTVAAAGTDQTICSSTVTMAGNTPAIGNGQWARISGPNTPTITTPSSPLTTITGLIPGTYIFQWTITNGVCPSSADNVQIVVDPIPTASAAGNDQTVCNQTSITLAGNTALIGTGTWTMISGPNTPTITNPALASTTVTGIIPGTYVFQWTVANGVCPSSSDQVQVVNLNDIQNTINSALVLVCSGQVVTITGNSPTGGNGTYTYQWESSPDGTVWSPVVGANSQNLTITLTATTCFRRKVTSLPCETFSNVVCISVQPSITNNIIAADQQICINTNPATLTGSIPTGGNSVYNYQWLQSTDGGTTWINIPAANGINYTPGVLVGQVMYTRVVTTNLCNGPLADTSSAVTVTINQDSDAQFAASSTIGCFPFDLSTVINVTHLPDRNGQYQWFADDVLFATNTTGVFPGYTMANHGDTVIIKLVTTSQFGCRPDTMQMQFITVKTAFANFTKTANNGCGPLAVSFTNTSSILNDPSIEFFWNFGNGISSNTLLPPNPVIFNNDAVNFRDTTYYITLKAYNGCDTTIFLDSVTVFPNSKARFGVDTTRGCSPFTIHISNTSPGNNTAYYWDFGDGTRDTTFTNGLLTHTYNTGTVANYTIRLISENQCTRDTQSIDIVVTPNIIQPFVSVFGNQLSGCAPHLVTFSNSTVGATQLTWNFGDGSPVIITPNNQNTVTHLYNNAGNYTVVIRLQNDCSDTTINRTVNVYAPPSAGFNLSSIRICTGQPVTATNISTDANSYEWNWGDGSGSNGTTHVYNTAGVYTVQLVAIRVHPSGFICTDTATQQITVLDKILAQINVAPGRLCAPYTLNVNAGNISGFSEVKWVVYDSSTVQGEFHSTGLSATYVYTVPGTYSVKLVVKTTDNCKDSATYQFQVLNNPVTTFEPNITTCDHDTTVIYTAVTTNPGNGSLNYKWFIDGVIEGTGNPFSFHVQVAHNNPNVVQYQVRALAENVQGCGDTSAVRTLTIQPLPIPNITVSPAFVQQQPDYEFTFKDIVATNPNKTYLWSMGDRSLQTRSGQEITYEYGDTGTYKVKLLVTDFATGCSALDSVKVTILHVPGYLHVPNAMCLGCANNSLRQFLPLGKGLKKYKLTIYTTWGQKIFETTKLNADGSPSEPWDGRFNGKVLQQDVYTWQIEGMYTNGTEWKGMLYPGSNKHVKSGFITIIK